MDTKGPVEQWGIVRKHVRFSHERVEKVRNGHRITSVLRSKTEWMRVSNEPASQHPVREPLWALGIGVVSVATILSALQPLKLGSLLTGGFLALVCVALIRHQFARITVLEIRGEDGSIRIDLEEHLTDSEVERLNRQLADELAWPTD
jgi:hypothetical protein